MDVPGFRCQVPGEPRLPHVRQRSARLLRQRTWMGVRTPLIVLMTIARPQAHPLAVQVHKTTPPVNGVATTPRAVRFSGH